jgi:hypothetical protein
VSFSAAVYQNEFLPEGGRDVSAVVTVTATGAAMTSSVEKAVVLMVDTSGSMSMPQDKIRAARKAAATAIDLLPDGTLFAVIAGSHTAQCVYPHRGSTSALARADDTTRDAATNAVKHLSAEGGTAISTWLDLAKSLFDTVPGAIRLAYLLTDGRNESEAHELLEQSLARCQGVFQCDARGVGADWEVNELRLITSSLLGEVDIISSPEEMDDDFRAFLERAIGKTVANVRLRVWTPQGATVRLVQQVAPTIEDLGAMRIEVDARTGDYPTGAWAGDESRDYHVLIDVPPGDVGDEKLAARISLVLDDEAVSQVLVRAVWTDDEALSTRINPQVAHYTGQAELAQAIQEGLEARKNGDPQTATFKLGRAVQLAHESGNEGTVRLLKKVVDVDDPATGTVRLKRKVEALDEMALDTRSTRTVRVSKGGGGGGGSTPS